MTPLRSIDAFSPWLAPTHTLRGYQLRPARAIARAILRREGGQFAVVFSRQSGKDEMLAQLIAWTLLRHAVKGGTIVVVAPTLTPQAKISMDRLTDRLLGNPQTRALTSVRGNAVHVGNARAVFVSGARRANARGLTADLALIANEAQDIEPDVWDAVFDPMAASTNAVTLYMGTVWTRSTLLARQMAYLSRQQESDGVERVFRVPWDVVARDVPAYGDYVRARIAERGEANLHIQSEYFLREIDGQSSLFPPRRLALLAGDHPRRHSAEPGKRYALLIDVAGAEESGGSRDAFAAESSRRDSTALTVVEVDTQTRADRQAVFRVVDRQSWTGVAHTSLHAQLVHLATTVWRVSWVVVDATGIGSGLASFLEHSVRPQGIRVEPFVFTASSKSALGWSFVDLIDTGRYQEYRHDDDALTDLFLRQMRAVEYDIAPGTGDRLRWSVPTAVGHDDLVMSAALTVVLDRLNLRLRIAIGS